MDFITSVAAIQPRRHILDLCCGQGRHCLELARRGFKNVMGVDRSRYLVRLAKKRAQNEGLQVLFKEGDARNPRLPESSFDCVAIMGNSFGYFSNKQDDEKVLTADRQDSPSHRPARARHHRRRAHGKKSSTAAPGSGSTSTTSCAVSARSARKATA